MLHTTSTDRTTGTMTEEPESVQAARAHKALRLSVEMLIGSPTMTRVTLTATPPLLVQLRMAVASSQGAGGGAATSPRERNTLDLSAVELMDIIDTEAREILEAAASESTEPLPASPLGKVSLLSDALANAPLELLSYAAQAAARWEDRIATRFTPDRLMEINAPCPACGVQTISAPEAQYTDAPMKPRGALAYNTVVNYVGCRACQRTWEGPDGLRQLEADQAKYLEEREAAAAAEYAQILDDVEDELTGQQNAEHPGNLHDALTGGHTLEHLAAA